MLDDDSDFPSVEDREDDIEREIPELDRDWSDWWFQNTIHKQLFQLSQEVQDLWQELKSA